MSVELSIRGFDFTERWYSKNTVIDVLHRAEEVIVAVYDFPFNGNFVKEGNGIDGIVVFANEVGLGHVNEICGVFACAVAEVKETVDDPISFHDFV